VIDFPSFQEPRLAARASLVLAEWEGSVTRIGSDVIFAKLTNIRGADGGERQQCAAEIPWEEVSSADHALIQEGALFRLTVGYQIDDGTRRRFSSVVFRRLPAWTRRDMEDADHLATEQFNAISVE
jgi:hypothetical protein